MEAEKTKQLNPVDATMIAQISPGEFESVYHAQQFAIERLKEWLPKYKFKHWNETENRKLPVTPEMKTETAERIATRLIDQSLWRTHRRSLKIKDLEEIGLRIRRLEESPPLCEIVYRIKTVLKLLFGSSTHYKVFVTEHEKLFLDAYSNKGPTPQQNIELPIAKLTVKCSKCGGATKVFAKFGPLPVGIEQQLLKSGSKFPVSNKLICKCGYQMDLLGVRNQLERQMGKKMVE